MTPQRIVRGVARRVGLQWIWIPGIRPFQLQTEGREFIPCHACGESGYRPFIRDPEHQVVRCIACGLYYVNPVPHAERLNELVHDSSVYTDDQLVKRDFFKRRAERLFDTIETMMPPGRLLDVGCAIGTELHTAKDRGWRVTGIELARSSAVIARDAGFDVRSSSLVDVQFPSRSFDLITMNHVLEHIAHTPAFMHELRRILADRGMVFVSLPNVHAWKFYLRRGAYAWTFHREHYLHFSVQTLSRFLRRYGFEVIDIKTSRWLDFHDLLESRSPLFQAVNRAIEQRDLGIEIFCLARASRQR